MCHCYMPHKMGRALPYSNKMQKGLNVCSCIIASPLPIFFHKFPSPIFSFGFHSTPQDLRLDSPCNVSEAHDESDELLANLFVCGRFQIHLFFLCNPMHVTCFITGRWLWDTWLVKAISPIQCVSCLHLRK